MAFFFLLHNVVSSAGASGMSHEKEQRDQRQYESRAQDIDPAVGDDARLRHQLPVDDLQCALAGSPWIRALADQPARQHLDPRHGGWVANGNVLGEYGAELGRVVRQKRSDGSDTERSAKLAEKVVKSRALWKLAMIQLGERDRGQGHEHHAQTDSAHDKRPEEV